MKINVKSKNFVIWTVIIVFVVGLGYWYGARPYFAVKNCHGIALDNSGYNADQWRSWAGNSKSQTDYVFVYELCMHKSGLSL